MSIALNPADGTEVAYDAAGEGPAVVLLHGSALSKAIWRGLGYVRALEGFRVVRVDLRGHGRSGKPEDARAYRMARHTGDVLAVLDAEGIAEAHAVGYSLGSRVAFSLAATAPDRIASLTSLGGTFRPQRGEVEKVFFPGYLEALQTGRIEAFVEGLEAAGRAVDPATRQAFLANDPAALAACFTGTEEDPGLPEAVVAQLSLPALLMAGTRDPQRLADSRRAAELMPNARFVELPGRTHAGTLAPAGPILDELIPFLRSAS
ncbi:alpha/beta hydrolase [Sinomonas cellulolyticus]|uniref:Alpha/beta fold hydrolase n=1 Tax=Sinomonas cellulolyticus TaxID=2801916 RepID=A0ABS1K495_9MICC|nr:MULTISPECIES: alpha/beta hydrolase [Sinomonas]MBL0706471.1 alpha/beta fold hydrolase [Sinomonas cellulolyticus]GHG44805.1 alpha/beta hydrolase [Sinomonas sp. KCTC 49339]